MADVITQAEAVVERAWHRRRTLTAAEAAERIILAAFARHAAAMTAARYLEGRVAMGARRGLSIGTVKSRRRRVLVCRFTAPSEAANQTEAYRTTFTTGE